MVLVQLKRTQALAALTGAGLLLAGCQSYEPRPLKLAEHRQAWLDRSSDSESVRAFARQLETQTSSPATFDPSDGISLPEAEVIALVFNADLRIARAGADIAAATAEHAGLWEDPVFLIDVLKITESVSSQWVITPGLSLTIPLSGRLEAEKSRADAALHADLYRIAETEWTVCTAVRAAWFEWSAAELRLQQTGELTDRLQSLVDATARLAEAGELPRTEATLFAIELSQRRNEIIGLRREVREREFRLRHLLGLAPTAAIKLLPSVSVDPPGVPSLDVVVAENLSLARLRQEYEVAEQRLRREILAQRPDLTLGPLYETDQGQSRIGFLGAIPLPLFNENRQGIAQARAQREQARAQYEAQFEQLAGELALASERMASLRTQRASVESVLTPLIDRQVDDAGKLLHIGEGGSLVMLESLVRAQEIKMMLIDLRRDESLASTEITRLGGPGHALVPHSDAATAADGGTS